MYKVMLQTVGTGQRVYEAITKSIYEANPSFVYFFCSKGSEKTLAQVLEKIVEENILADDRYEMVPIPDINDHNDVFQRVVAVIDKEKTKGVSDNQFVVDYTSGTKAMSVGLALAGSAATPGASFRYVGSKIRDNTYGRVYSGEEDIKIRRSPTYYLGYEDERQIQFLVKNHAYRAANDLIDEVLGRNPSRQLQKRLQLFQPVCNWLDAWDHFDYSRARDISLEIKPKNLETFGMRNDNLEEKKSFLESLCRQSFIHDDQQEAVPSHEIICDLYQNAQRRLDQNLRSDAWTRLIRIHFMILQFMLMTKFGVNPVYPEPETITKFLREEEKISSEVRKEPLNRRSALKLLKKLDPEVKEKLFDLDIGMQNSNPILGRGFHPAPKQEQLEEDLENLRIAFEDYTDKLQTEEPIPSLMQKARFPELH